MEEVPASPEIVKRKKIRRKHGSSFTRLSFQQRAVNATKHSPAKSAADCSPATVFGSTSRGKLSTFYFDDGSAEIATVDADPLASAILLEKANTISTQSRVPSPDFIAATAEDFVSATELAKRANANHVINQPEAWEHNKPNDKNHNYSFTQLELDSQMINIFAAAELLTGTAREDQKKETDCGAPMISSVETNLVEENNSRSKQTAAPCERTLVQNIVDDFSEDDGFSWAIDYSVIKTESLRLRLLQLQDYNVSPPKAVKREAVPCRRYGKSKRLAKDPPARRLSYGTDCSSRVEQPLSDDEIGSPSEKNVSDGDGTDMSMDGVALNESVLIQANLTQLSAFFSQAIETSSIDCEPPFYGFTPEPASPISLASNEERSPRALRFEFRPFECFEEDTSLLSAEDKLALPLPAKCSQIEQLLDDDEDLFMLAQAPNDEQVPRSSRYGNAIQHSDGTTRSRGSPGTDDGFIQPQVPPLTVRFTTASGRPIRVADAALLGAKAMFAEEQVKMSMDCTEQMNVENKTPSMQEIQPDVQHARSLAVVQLGKVNKCELASIAESSLPLGRVFHGVSVEPSIGGNHHQMARPSKGSQVVFSTASGKPIDISEKALVKARATFAEDEPKVCSSKHKVDAPEKNPHVDQDVTEDASKLSLPFASVFSTASGKPIAISGEAFVKARTMFTERDEPKVPVSKLHLEAAENDPPVDVSMTANASNFSPPFASVFSTSSGKPSAISEEASTLFAEEEPKAPESNHHLEATEKKPQIDKVIVDDASKLSLPFASLFSTASGKPIAISGEAFVKARTMFTEREEPTVPESKLHLESFAEENHLVDEVIAEDASNLSLPFAGGRQIAISKCALAKAQHIFDEEMMNRGKENLSKNTILSIFGGAYSAGGSKISMSEKAPGMAHAVFDEEQTNAHDQEPANAGSDRRLAVGFTTAGGRTITVTKQALDRAKSVFADDEELAKMVGISKEPIVLPNNFTVETVLPFEQAEQGLARESHRKRKPSASQEEPMTPTKRLRMNHLQPLGGLQTSTPAAALVDTPKPAAAGREMEQFFAELDDKEFEELFRNQPQPAGGGAKRQNQLLSRFEQCASQEETTANTSHTSHWDDSFTELLPKLPLDERRKATSACPAEEVQRERRVELQKQREFIDSKPEEMRRPRVSTFCSKKRRTDRVGLEQFVGEGGPTPSVAISATTSVSLDNAMGFRFDMVEYCGEAFCSSNTTGITVGSDAEAVLLLNPLDSSVGVEEMRQCFLASSGIDPRLIPAGWVENAWRWIVSKLAALERNFGAYFRGALTPENVFHQLQYRYHVEIDCSRRPPLRKMLEKDDIASRRMVLFVSNVFPGGKGSIVGCELELSDGWYAVRTVIDVPLAGAVRAGKIAIGTKLMIQGGELLNHKDGCSPLEVPPEVRLKIHANSTRRVRWPVKLGYCRWPVPFLIPCHGIHERGGLIGRFRAFVVRVYPLVYVEKVPNESHGSVLRSERMQQRHNRRIDASQLDSLHKLYNEIQQEIERERAAAVISMRDVRVTESTPCSQLQELLEAGLDVSLLDFELTFSQHAVVQRFQQQQLEELQTEINRRVRAQIDKRCNHASATSLLKVRLMDPVKPDRAFVLSIWRPTDDVRFVMQEQHFLELRTITANGSRNGDVQLTAHKSSTYTRQPTPPDSPAVMGGRFSRVITSIGDIDPRDAFRPPFNEFDTIGVVVHVDTADSKKFQSIYLADTAMELLCVNFWHGLAEYAYDDVVHERAILCVANLQWRTIGRQNQAIVQSFATEYTTFTENPRSGQQRAEWDRFHQQLGAIDGEEFFQRCRVKVRDLKDAPASGSFSTPLQQHRSVSRLAQPCHSTPLAGAGGSMAKRKMETLAAICGSPPTLSPIVIHSHPSARKGFKTPARLEDSSLGAPPSDADDSAG